jgi:hypothetical protein
MRLILIAIATLWAAGAVIAFVQLREKSLDAKLTAGYLILWPAALVLVYISQPVPLWVSLPVMFGFIPWFLAGPHLWQVLRDPASSKPDELVGIPIAYWKWGSIAAVLLGLLFGGLVTP